MKEYEICTLLNVEYKNTSTLGNPAYYVEFLDSDDNYHCGYTSSNATAGYTAGNYRNDKNCPIFLKYHFTRSGNCIIDYIKHNTADRAKEEFEKISA